MIQGGCGLGFAFEPGTRLRVAGYCIGQEFERNKTMQAEVFGLVNHAHAPTTELFDNLVVRNRSSNHVGKSYV
jgi:hypothetical protein